MAKMLWIATLSVELLAAPPGSLAGKIAVVTQRMVRTQDGSGYGAAIPIRRSGPSEAARRGAVAYLLRSLGTDSYRLPHTPVPQHLAIAALGGSVATDANGIEAEIALFRTYAELHPVLLRIAEASQLQLPRPGPDGQPNESSQLARIATSLDLEFLDGLDTCLRH